MKSSSFLWLLIFVLAVAWRVQNLAAYGLSNDEGVYLMWGRLAADGYTLYRQTYAVQPPLFLEGLALAFRLAGSTIQAGRWAILPAFGLLAVALSWLAYRSGRWPAALTALVLLSLSPLAFTFSRLAMAEIPATALAVLSIALCFRHLDTGRRYWLLASGLALGLSLLNKVLNPFIIIPVVWLLGVYAQNRRPAALLQSLLSNLLVWGLGLLLPILAVPLLYDPAAAYDQLLRFRNELRTAIPGSPAETWAQFETFSNTHWGFWLLAFGGIMASAWRAWGDRGAGEQGSRGAGEIFSPHRFIPYGRLRASAVASPLFYPLTWLIWLLAGVAMLWWHTPLFPHHFVVLLPPLILLGTELITNLIALPKQKGKEAKGEGQRVNEPTFSQSLISTPVRQAVQSPLFLLLLALIFIAAFNLPAIIRANNETAAIVTGGREAEAIKLLQAVSGPSDFIMGDSQLLIFMANRRTPPPLGDVALVAIKAGRQTSERMTRLTEQFQAPAVVQWSLRLPWLPDYLEWVNQNYLAHRLWDNDHIIHFVRRLPPGQPLPNTRMDRLGQSITLRGYELPSEPVQTGQDLNLKVYWQADAPPERDYTVFTQLLDRNGALVAGWDSQPLGGYFPTSQWPSGEIITDIVRLPLPADLPPGDYTLITGMYPLDTQERLPTNTGSDYLTLTTIKME